mmetsp:Transcript_11721/g.26082  ORF Transcript_11721/g.26082 Transcript_11721/m.26082 type:complete len:301 (-) Transcript_11721:1305-2207(-)
MPFPPFPLLPETATTTLPAMPKLACRVATVKTAMDNGGIDPEVPTRVLLLPPLALEAFRPTRRWSERTSDRKIVVGTRQMTVTMPTIDEAMSTNLINNEGAIGTFQLAPKKKLAVVTTDTGLPVTIEILTTTTAPITTTTIAESTFLSPTSMIPMSIITATTTIDILPTTTTKTTRTTTTIVTRIVAPCSEDTVINKTETTTTTTSTCCERVDSTTNQVNDFDHSPVSMIVKDRVSTTDPPRPGGIRPAVQITRLAFKRTRTSRWSAPDDTSAIGPVVDMIAAIIRESTIVVGTTEPQKR